MTGSRALLLQEPKGSRQFIAYVRAREQGHARSMAAAYAHIDEGEAALIDKSRGLE